MTFENIVNLQREYGLSNVTKDISYRKASLERMLDSLTDNEQALYRALSQDLGKSRQEAFISEIAMVKQEINYAIDHVEKWAAKKRVYTPLYLLPAKNYKVYEPYGVVLIISPWNNPVLFTLLPLVGAIAAGNTAILKISKKCANTAEALAAFINSTFDKRYVYAIDEPLSNSEIMSRKYDFIFFTGSERVGKSVMRAAAEKLTPVSLQMGGKCPCIIGPEADLRMAAKKIIWAKTLNAGQNALAPDYVVVPKYQKAELIRNLREMIDEMIRDPFNNDAYPRIIDLHHFMRLTKHILGESNIIGGIYDDKSMKIEPTILPNTTFDSEIMKEEIYGPILPILEYDDIYEVIDIIKRRPKPLACYVFTQNKDFADEMTEKLPCGGCCINDCMVQIFNPRLPFGGVGESGNGKYRGRYSFELFSNTKSVSYNISGRDKGDKYPPYNDEKYETLRKILK